MKDSSFGAMPPLAATLWLCACNATPVIEPGQIVGPLVGHVSDSTANLWICGGPEARFEVEVAEVEGDAAGTWIVPSLVEAPDDGDRGSARLTLIGLRPQTQYRYRVWPVHDPAARPAWAPGEGSTPITGTFTTAPPPAEPDHFTVAVASCIKTNHSRQQAWAHLLAQEPELQLLLGDNAYINSAQPERHWRGHLTVRSVPEFAEVIRQVPTYAIWDDHDYAGNDVHGAVRGKEHALQAFRQLWANPAAGTRDVPGVFYSFCWGDVEFFMLDGRYHRCPAKDPRRQWVLGEGQFRWLIEALQRSQSTFKVLACGSTLREKGADRWYDGARERLFGAIVERGIEGVIFLSGDVHYSAIRSHPLAEHGSYELTEVISSGIANSRAQSFATLEFDTTAADPTVRVRIIDGDGAVREQRLVRRSELCTAPALTVQADDEPMTTPTMQVKIEQPMR